MPLPAGTPYSILAEATHRFNVELAEKPIKAPVPIEEGVLPMAWVLIGDREELMKAKAFICEKLKETLKKFE
ncbi:MAG: hypothetical protein N3D12_02460 [Candidatus Methanomethyliaceae archaeon]|nr:hypothetical protein [Candidatus Methanomethyliaceae archaeon]